MPATQIGQDGLIAFAIFGPFTGIPMSHPNGKAIHGRPPGLRPSARIRINFRSFNCGISIKIASISKRIAIGWAVSWNFSNSAKSMVICNVPAKWPENPGLGSWLSGQRLRRGSLPLVRRRLLEMAGMDLTPLDNQWEAMFQELAAFKAVYGHCRVSERHNRKLALWVGNIRARHKVTPVQKRRLDKLGFAWNVEESLWQQHLADLKDFARRFGHTNVPARWPENKSLATWVFSLRSERSTIPASSRKELENLGFDFEQVHTRLWERRFQELARFAQQHGHCRVPIDYPANPELGKWVGTQRANFERMSPARTERLRKLGFIWKTLEMSPRRDWDQRYLELLAFRRKYGHVNVPHAWPENQPLAHWVARQRKRDKSKLTRQQLKKLNDIDFIWDVRDRRWCVRIAALTEFKARFGHCDVPGHWSENKPLGAWTYKVREQKRAGNLTSERIQELTRRAVQWLVLPPVASSGPPSPDQCRDPERSPGATSLSPAI
jgi:hypothetical protein